MTCAYVKSWMRSGLVGAAMCGISALPSEGVAAQDVPQVDIVDFLVDWRSFEGQTVDVLNGKIVMANVDFALLSSSAGNVTLRNPWQDKEHLRFALKNCSKIASPEQCRVAVRGEVAKNDFEDKPILKNVLLMKAN